MVSITFLELSETPTKTKSFFKKEAKNIKDFALIFFISSISPSKNFILIPLKLQIY